jgi:hypothetical protein
MVVPFTVLVAVRTRRMGDVYDTSFLRGIVPNQLCPSGWCSRLQEIPTTVPTDIRVDDELHEVVRSEPADEISMPQSSRTAKLIEAGALVMVTHLQAALSERSDFLDAYGQYQSQNQHLSELGT